jgi:uncharacterized protein YqeY
MPPDAASPPLPDRLRAALPVAMKARHATAVAALRSALSALANAEAVAAPTPARSTSAEGLVAGATAGLGSGEAVRRSLSEREAVEIVRTEIHEREEAAALVEAAQPDRAADLRAEAAVLTSYLDG